MKRINLTKVRRDEIRAYKKYEAFGTTVFGRALNKQAEQGETFDPEIMIDAYIEFYRRVFTDSATREYNSIRMQNPQKDFIPDGFFLSTWQSWIENYVRTQLKQVVDKVNRNTFKNMEAIIAQGIAEGWQPFTLAQAIKDKIGSKARALAIARTEATTANAIGKQKSALDWSGQTGQTLYKKWVHGGSKEPRETHLAQGNMPPVPEADVFPLVDLYLPGDIDADPSDRINCSCTVIYMSQDYVAEYYPEALPPLVTDSGVQTIDIQDINNNNIFTDNVTQQDWDLASINPNYMSSIGETLEDKTIRAYTVNGSRVNYKIRDNKLDQQDLAFIRNLDISLEKQPIYTGEVYRGVNSINIFDYINNVGEEVEWAAYTSTSKSIKVTEGFGTDVLFIIQSKRGRDVIKQTAVKAEEEVLMARNTKFIIEKVVGNKVYLNEIL
jgi:hypothetical protein